MSREGGTAFSLSVFGEQFFLKESAKIGSKKEGNSLPWRHSLKEIIDFH